MEGWSIYEDEIREDFAVETNEDYITGVLTDWAKTEKRLEVAMNATLYVLMVGFIWAGLSLVESFFHFETPLWCKILLAVACFTRTITRKSFHNAKLYRLSVKNGWYRLIPVKVKRNTHDVDGHASYEVYMGDKRIVQKTNKDRTFTGFGPMYDREDKKCLFVLICSENGEVLKETIIPLYDAEKRFCKKNEQRGRAYREELQKNVFWEEKDT